MLRFLCVFLLPVVSGFPQAQIIDWNTLLHDLVSQDPAKSKAAGEQFFNDIAPRLCHEESSLAANELAGSLEYFADKDSKVRLQVSALLSVIPMCRGTDSATVLASAVPKIIEHIHDPAKRIRENSVRTLALLQPDIPPEAVSVLIKTLDNPERDLASLAAYGLVLVAGKNAEARNALFDLLSLSSPKQKQLLAIGAIGAAHSQNEALVQALGEFLLSPQPDLASASVHSIANCGPPCIWITHEQLETFAAGSHPEDLKRLAQSLADQYKAAQ